MRTNKQLLALIGGFFLLLGWVVPSDAGVEPGDVLIPHPSAPVIEKVSIPAGEFLMGTDAGADPDEGPQHGVYLEEFQIGRFEVTWAQYQAFIDAGGYENKEDNGFWSRKGLVVAGQPVWLVGDAWGQTLEGPQWTPEGLGPVGFADRDRWPPRPNDPVIGISYWEAEAYCRFVGGRLPTEAEWEKAASWGPEFTEPRTYPWGEDTSLPLPANGFEACEGFSRIEAVDDPRYEGDVSAYGVRGMGGNASEWVADMYDPDYYSQSPEPGLPWKNPFNLMAKRLDFVEEVGTFLPAFWSARGGSFKWGTNELPYFRCADRDSAPAVGRDMTHGFRVVWDVQHPPTKKPVKRTERPGAAVEIPAGNYMMGHTMGVPADGGNRADESPQHSICLDRFWVGTFEVTWYEYKKFIEAGGYGEVGGPKPQWWSEEGWAWRCNPPGAGGLPELAVVRPDLMGLPRASLGYDWQVMWKGPWINDGDFSSPPDDHPVVGVSWYEAEAYCAYVGGRLLTEAEWEVAATWNPETQTPMQFPWGNLFTFTHEAIVANTGDDPKYGGMQTSPVGMYPDGKSPLGCYDMAGNTFEWVQDWYHPESYAQHSTECGGPVVTPDWMKIDSPTIPGYTPAPGFKVNRGGGFDPTFDGTYSQRSRTRGTDGAMDFRNFTFGFRVAWDSDPQSVARAQEVRPPYESGTDTPAQDPVDDVPSPPPSSDYARVFPTSDGTEIIDAIDRPGKEDWYQINGPAGALVEIDLDANGGSDDLTDYSPLDAFIEIWQSGYGFPVVVRDDEIAVINEDRRDAYLDPPVFQHRIPEEGFFWAKVRAYTWPGEGSQAGLTPGERSYSGPEYVYDLSFRAPAVEENSPTACSDINGDGVVNSGDLFTVVEGIKSKSSKRLKADLDGDGMVGYRDVFCLQDIWNDYGAKCASN